MSTTRSRGFNELYGSWKTTWSSRREPRELCLVEGADVAASEPDAARGRLEQPEYAAAHGRLAGARFPDQAERLTLRDVERDAVDGADAAHLPREDPAPHREVLGETFYPEQGFRHGTAPGPSRSAWGCSST